MPQIPQIEVANPGAGYEVSDRPETAATTAARRVSVLANEGADTLGRSFARVGRAAGAAVEEYGKHVTAQEISEGSGQLAGTINQVTQAYNAALKNSDPNDPTVGPRVLSAMDEPLQKWVDGFTTTEGQKWAQERAATIKEHFGEKVIADQAQRAGDAVIVNAHKTMSQASSLVMNDPTSLSVGLDLVKSSVHALVENSPALSPDQASKVETETVQKMSAEVVKSAFYGAAKNNPSYALSLLNRKEFTDNLDGDQIKGLESYANEMTRQKQEDQRWNIYLNDKAKTDASENRAQQIISSWADPKTGRVTVPADAGASILADPALRSSERLTLLGATQRLRNQDIKVPANPSLVGDLMNRSLLPPTNDKATTVNEVYSHLGKDLNQEDANFVLSHLKGPLATDENKTLYNAALKAGSDALTANTPLGVKDPSADMKVLRFQSWFQPAYENALKSGKTPAQLLSPDSPDYMLTPDVMQRFNTTTGDDLLNTHAPAGSSLWQRIFGSSQDDTKPAASVPIPPAGGAPPTGGRPPLASFFGGLNGGK